MLGAQEAVAFSPGYPVCVGKFLSQFQVCPPWWFQHISANLAHDIPPMYLKQDIPTLISLLVSMIDFFFKIYFTDYAITVVPFHPPYYCPPCTLPPTCIRQL